MKNADIGGDDPSHARDIDLSRVAPLRRPEVRRRIEAILTYLRIKTPSDADRAAAAASLGIGPQQFMTLVRAWLTHGDAIAIAKAGANAGAARAPRRRGLPPETRVAAEEALRRLPASASHKDAIAAVRAACERRRTRSPSDSMVSYLRLGLRRDDPSAAAGEAGLLVGRAIAALPVDGRMTLPEVALAVDMRDAAVIAAEIVDEKGSSPRRSFKNAIKAAAARAAAPVTIGADDASLASALPCSRTVSRFMAGRLLARTIGRGIGGVRLSYGPLASPDPTRKLRAKADAPLDAAEAAAALAAAVAAHNEARKRGTADKPDLELTP